MARKTIVQAVVNFELDIPDSVEEDAKRQWAWDKVNKICSQLSEKPKLGVKIQVETPFEYRK
jgi:hypothetical protein